MQCRLLIDAVNGKIVVFATGYHQPRSTRSVTALSQQNRRTDSQRRRGQACGRTILWNQALRAQTLEQVIKRHVSGLICAKPQASAIGHIGHDLERPAQVQIGMPG